MTVNAEQDEAAQALQLLDNLNVLDRVASRKHVESQTASTDALAALLTERSLLRTTLRRCAVFGCVLAGAWSVFLFISLH